MRIMIKGGVWKNTEDEILKAAVMKYGKNQWARISSLLVRKSAKQCKARWYEWLDPSIKKTEWTREEDEKLLHLAKLMPTQWRTIAPIVGRTPSQCLERYEKLLDAACVKDENYEPSDDPRKLRPGEIDPNPESKPARPDPVDMDEDEKEMLSEARARLANTRGKKAKRKAREKQLEEARRLASLQKRRELKAAGIDNRHRKRKRKGIDYNAEIPFEKKPPPGFFDVADEERLVEQPKFPTTIEELEGKRRVDVEAQLRKQDTAKNKIAERQDGPSAILQVNKLNDPETVRKRSKLMLPAPQISDHELEEIAKMGYASDLIAGSLELAEGSGATRALLANYAQTPRQGMTPLRTPQRTPAGKGDAIMMEAENLARLRESQTPLLGGENPELHPSDFSGVTPKKREIQTPNPMATPLSTPGPMGLTPRIGMTPSRDGYSFGMTPKGTPIRDELHINEMDMHDNAKLELRRQAEVRRNLRSGLTNLPQPKNEYQIVIQPPPEENEEPEDKIEEDMSDRMAREKAEEEARQQALLRKRSKVLQRELPRPPAASLELVKKSLMRADEDKSSFVPPTSIEQADEMIRMELLNLLEHDNAKFPLEEKVDKEKKKGVKRSSSGKSAVSVPEIEDFDEDELKEADSFIQEESQFLRVAMGHENESFNEFIEAHKTSLKDLMFFPTRNAYGLSSVAGNMEKLAAMQNEFENVKKKMDDEAKMAQRLEQKIKLLTHGYQMRAGKLWSQIEATYKQMDTAGTEVQCFQALQKQEQLAAVNRINRFLEEVKKQQELEKTLQRRYEKMIEEQDRMQRLLEEYRLQAQKQEEIAAKNRALELLEPVTNQTDMPSSVEVNETSMSVDHQRDGAPIEQVDAALEQPIHPSPMDADGVEQSRTGMDLDVIHGDASALELLEPVTNQTDMPSTKSTEPIASLEVNETSMSGDHQRDGAPIEQVDAALEQPIHSSLKDADGVVLINGNEAPIPSDTQPPSADGFHPSGVLSQSHTIPMEESVDNGDALSSSIGAQRTKMMVDQLDQIADGTSNNFEVVTEEVHVIPHCSTLESKASAEDHHAVTEAGKPDGVIIKPDEGFQETTNDGYGNGDFKLVSTSEGYVVNSDGDTTGKTMDAVGVNENVDGKDLVSGSDGGGSQSQAC
ncbi:cell division cycle 5-like protein [Telopea speciosissima]|uniref:cell division cycle 5-like protein n=1 Tax=Telopea speciosissima TaxID=54955 RepID=UPI001CC4E954|nr:cell division cycle 5-like protein [Telopea speciosissima]